MSTYRTAEGVPTAWMHMPMDEYLELKGKSAVQSASHVVYPSKLKRQSVAEWLSELLAERLIGACIELDGRHLHVNVREINDEPQS